MLHGHRPALKLACLYLINLGAPLVPLERVQSLDPGRSKTVLSVKVDSEVGLYQVAEFLHNLIRVFVQQSLQLGNTLIIIKVLFVLSI